MSAGAGEITARRNGTGAFTGHSSLAGLLLMLALCGFLLERSEALPPLGLNGAYVVAAALLIAYLRALYRHSRAMMLTSFYQLFYFLGMILSALLIANGSYMFEIRRFGTANGLVWVLVGFMVAGLECTALGFDSANRWRLRQQLRGVAATSTRIVIILLTGVALGAAVLVLLRYGAPVLRGVDRVTFWRQIVGGPLVITRTLILQSFFFAAFYYLWARQRQQRLLLPSLVIFAYAAATAVVLGEKLSAFIVMAAVWFALVAVFFPDFRLRRSHVVQGAVALLLLVASVLISYLTRGFEAAYALARGALQAQLLWSVLADNEVLAPFRADWGCYFGCGDSPRGIDFIAYRYLPRGLYLFYTSKGSQLTGFVPALPMLTFGFAAAAAIHCLMMAGIGFVQGCFVKATRHGGVIIGFLLYKLMASLNLLWLAALQSTIPGIAADVLLVGLYYWLFTAQSRARLPAASATG